MITIFNRKELALTSDMAEQSRIREALNAEGIDYIIRTRGASGVSASRISLTSGVNYQYIIYVRKGDYSRAGYAIRKNK